MRVAAQEFADQRQHMHAAEHGRRGDGDAAARRGSLLRHRFQLLEPCEQPPRRLQRAGAGLGEGDGAGGAVQQPDLQPLLQRRDGAGHGGSGAVHLARRLGEAGMLGDRDEDGQGVEAVHAVFCHGRA